MNERDWVLKNCKFAAFNAPQKGNRIEVPNRPGEYYFVTDKPEVGKDPRGQQFWHARVKDREGKEQLLSSDLVPSWQHFKGQNYPWHDEMLQQQQWNKQKKDQAGLIAAFEQQFRFQNGQPLARKTIVMIEPTAPGNLGAFAGEKLLVKDINYTNSTVSLEPLGEGLSELAGELQAVPAADLVAGAKPAMKADIMNDPVRLPSGERVTTEELMYMTPNLNRLAKQGKVTLEVQVYANYKGGKGEEAFINEMARYGIDPDNVQAMTNYRVNNVAAKIDAGGRQQNIFGAWQGNVIIEPPTTPEVIEEIKQVAPASQIQARKDGRILVQSNPLYKQMILLGVPEMKRTPPPLGSQAPAQMPVPQAIPQAV